MTRFEKEVIAFTSATHGFVHILELTYGALLASIALEFGANLFILGVLANIMGFFFGATSIPAGMISDRRKEKQLLVLCCLGMGVASAIIGVSPNIIVLGAGLLAMGMVLGIYHPTAAAFISRAVSKRGLGFGYQGIGGNVGLALGPITAGAIAGVLGWRAAYLILGAFPVALGIIILVALRSEPHISEQAPTSGPSANSSLRVMMLPMALLFGTAILNGFIYRALVTFLPLYLSQQISVPALSTVLVAGSFASLAFMFGVGGQFVGGYLAERIARERLAFAFFFISIPLLLLIGNSNGIMLVAATAAFAFFHFFGQPVNNMLMTDYIPSHVRGRIFGLYFFSNYGVGSFSAGALGYVASQMGLNWVFVISSVFALGGLGCITALWMKSRVIKRRIFSSET